MRPMPVVGVQPGGQGSDSLEGTRVRTSVSPFAKCALDEALGLAVGTRGVVLGEEMTQAELAAGLSKAAAVVTAAIVGEDLFHLHTQACVVGHRCTQEGTGANAFLIGQHLAVGNPGGVV